MTRAGDRRAHRRARQRGSVSVVWVGLLAMILIFLLAILEREWANYTRNLAEQTAVFAAEAGTRAHTAWARLRVTRYHYYRTLESEHCHEWQAKAKDDDADVCLHWHSHYQTHTAFDYPELDLREERLGEVGWLVLFACASDPWAGYACLSPPELLRRWVEFRPEATAVAEETFWQNWPQRRAARVMKVEVTTIPEPDGSQRLLRVSVDLELQPMFFPARWAASTSVEGRATVILTALEFG